MEALNQMIFYSIQAFNDFASWIVDTPVVFILIVLLLLVSVVSVVKRMIG